MALWDDLDYSISVGGGVERIAIIEAYEDAGYDPKKVDDTINAMIKKRELVELTLLFSKSDPSSYTGPPIFMPEGRRTREGK